MSQKPKNKMPIVGSIAWWLLLDRLHAPEWLMGIYWFLLIFVTVGTLYLCWKETQAEKKNAQ